MKNVRLWRERIRSADACRRRSHAGLCCIDGKPGADLPLRAACARLIGAGPYRPISIPYRSCQWPCAADQTRPSLSIRRWRLTNRAIATTKRSAPAMNATRDRHAFRRLWRSRSSFSVSERSRRSSLLVGIVPQSKRCLLPGEWVNVSDFHSSGSMQVRTLQRRYSGSRRP